MKKSLCALSLLAASLAFAAAGTPAPALNEKLAEACMYRGALYSLSGQAGLAKADYDRLVKVK